MELTAILTVVRIQLAATLLLQIPLIKGKYMHMY